MPEWGTKETVSPKSIIIENPQLATDHVIGIFVPIVGGGIVRHEKKLIVNWILHKRVWRKILLRGLIFSTTWTIALLIFKTLIHKSIDIYWRYLIIYFF